VDAPIDVKRRLGAPSQQLGKVLVERSRRPDLRLPGSRTGHEARPLRGQTHRGIQGLPDPPSAPRGGRSCILPGRPPPLGAREDAVVPPSAPPKGGLLITNGSSGIDVDVGPIGETANHPHCRPPPEGVVGLVCGAKVSALVASSLAAYPNPTPNS
jgi:hypothetical protein